MPYSTSPLRRSLLATAVLCSCHGIAFAEQVSLPEITVTAPAADASRPLNNAAVETGALQAGVPASSDSAHLLDGIPGVSLQGAGGVSALPVIHGMADDRLRVKVDGMDLISACGNHMNPPLSYIDPSNVGRAEVMAGITPVSLGGDSIGGTIIVESKAPVFADEGATLRRAEAGAFYRSNGNARGGNLQATLASDTMSLHYQGSTTESGNYHAADSFKPAGLAAAGREWLEGDEVGSSYYNATNQSLSFAMRKGIHQVELKVGKQDIADQGYPNQRMDMTGNDSTHLNLNYQGDYAWGFLDMRLYHEHTRHAMQFGDDKLYWYATPAGVPCTPSGGMSGCAAGMPMDTEGKNTGLVVKAEIPISERDQLRVGGEIQQYRLDDWWDPSGKGMWPDTFWNIRDGERDRLAVYGEWEAKWSSQWTSQVGLRGEQVRMSSGEVQGYNTTSGAYLAESTAFNAADRTKTDNNIDLTALARHTLGSNRSIEFGFARKTRSPNLYERYTWSTGGMAMRMINLAGDGNGYVGNLNLTPEIANTISASFVWKDGVHDKWGLTLTPYFTYIKDYIDAQRCVSTNTNCGVTNQTVTNDFVYLQFVNQDAQIYGIDISGHYPVAENTPYGDFAVKGLINYTHGKNTTTDDNLYNIMPLNMTVALSQRKGNWDNSAELQLVDSKDNVSATRNEVPTPGYALVNLRASYQWNKARFDFGVENLLDRFYYDPTGGIYTGQGMTMSGTGVTWGTPVPGMGRSIYAGVNVKF